MARRQVRYKYATLKPNIPRLSGETLDVILHAGYVIHGKLLSSDEKCIIVVNKREKKQQIEISSIYEIIVDTPDSLVNTI